MAWFLRGFLSLAVRFFAFLRYTFRSRGSDRRTFGVESRSQIGYGVSLQVLQNRRADECPTIVNGTRQIIGTLRKAGGTALIIPDAVKRLHDVDQPDLSGTPS